MDQYYVDQMYLRALCISDAGTKPFSISWLMNGSAWRQISGVEFACIRLLWLYQSFCPRDCSIRIDDWWDSKSSHPEPALILLRHGLSDRGGLKMKVKWGQKVTKYVLPWCQIWLSFLHRRCIRPGSTVWSKSGWPRWWSNTRIRDWEWPHVLSWSSRIIWWSIINWFGTPWWSSIWMTNWSILTWLRIINTWLWIWLWLEVRWWVSSMRIQPS